MKEHGERVKKIYARVKLSIAKLTNRKKRIRAIIMSDLNKFLKQGL